MSEQTWKGHSALGDGSEEDLTSNELGTTSSIWKTVPGKIYKWTDSEGDYQPVKVKCLGYNKNSRGGRIAYFEVLQGNEKGTYIQIDAYTHGDEIS